MAILPRSTMEDDIDVLSRGNHDFGDDTSYTRGDNLSNMHISFTRDEKDGSLHALSTAYSDLKKRYLELESRNNLLSQTIKDMEMQRMTGNRPVSGNFGGAAGPASGPAAQGAEMEQAQLRAELSYAQNLERQILRAKATINKNEAEKLDWQRKAEAFDRDLKRIHSLMRDKDIKIEQLETDLRTRGQRPSPRGRDSYVGLPAEADDKKYSESDLANLHAEISKLREENVQLRNFNESLQSRCVALEQKGDREGGVPGTMSMSLTLDDEKFIIEQMEGYRNMIKELKKQVSQQGDMLQKQKLAIKRLIAEVQTYRAKQSSLPYRTPDGASIHQPIKDGYTPNYTFQAENQFPDVHDRFGAGNYQTLNPQTLEPGSRDVGIKAETGRINNLTRRVSSTKLSDRGDEGNVPRTISPTSSRDRRSSPGQSSAIDRERPPISSGNNRQPVNSGARSKLLQPASGSSQDLNLYENIGNIPSPRSPVPSRLQNQTGVNVKVDDSRDQFDKFRFGQPVEPEDDYVNINEIHPHAGIGQGYDMPRSSASVQTHNEIGNRQPSSAEKVSDPVVSLSTQLCPVCRREFPNITMEDFQMHVISCMDSQDDGEFVTMVNPQGNTGSDNRICPMCEASFPAELPQSEFERHVQEHFGEDPITDRFEVLRP